MSAQPLASLQRDTRGKLLTHTVRTVSQFSQVAMFDIDYFATPVLLYLRLSHNTKS